MSFARMFALGCLALVLAACSGGGGGGGGDIDDAPIPDAPSAFSCSPVGGGAATISTFCINCPGSMLENGSLVADTDLSSSATLSFYNPDDTSGQSYEGQIKVVAQDGVVFPSGSVPGVAMKLPVGETGVYSATVVTYLDDVQRESHPVENFSGATNGELVYLGFSSPATMTFDAVEIVMTETLPNVEEHVFRVIEFCGDGALNP